ncbi:CoA-transferase, partial [Acinetobacter soli]|uniref:CoA-transferase n=1 Tax=Acinetobacter soli TaxID=487316 RepID=UPI00278BB346
ELIDGLTELGSKNLTIVSNNAGNGDYGLAKLLKTGAVKKIICSFPRQADSYVFDEL